MPLIDKYLFGVFFVCLFWCNGLYAGHWHNSSHYSTFKYILQSPHSLNTKNRGAVAGAGLSYWWRLFKSLRGEPWYPVTVSIIHAPIHTCSHSSQNHSSSIKLCLILSVILTGSTDSSQHQNKWCLCQENSCFLTLFFFFSVNKPCHSLATRCHHTLCHVFEFSFLSGLSGFWCFNISSYIERQ